MAYGKEAQRSSTVLHAYPGAADKIAQRPWGKARRRRQYKEYGKEAQRSSRDFASRAYFSLQVLMPNGR